MNGTSPALFAAAIVTVISALATGIVTIINALAEANYRRGALAQREQLATTTRSTEAKTDTLIGKAIEIHTLANSNLSEMAATLRVAQEEIRGLNKLIGEMLKREAPRGTDPTAGSTTGGQLAQDASVRAIEQNTLATAKSAEATVRVIRDEHQKDRDSQKPPKP